MIHELLTHELLFNRLKIIIVKQIRNRLVVCTFGNISATSRGAKHFKPDKIWYIYQIFSTDRAVLPFPKYFEYSKIFLEYFLCLYDLAICKPCSVATYRATDTEFKVLPGLRM